MSRYLFEVQYDGSAYFGWQRQPKQISVQERIESCLRQLHNDTSIEIIGCGRTDTGVHAQQSWFHTDIPDLFSCEHLLFKTNRMLPDDIAIRSVQRVKDDFHARFDAVSRTYRYYLHQRKNAFLKGKSLYFNQELNLVSMNAAAQHLLGTKDFTSFSKLHTDVKTNICTVKEAKWHILTTKDSDESQLYFEITADRFLRNMVRALTGTLMDVGTGKLSPDDIPRILAAKNRSEASVSISAHGLYLWDVRYPDTI